MLLEIAPGFEGFVVGFNGKALKLSERSQSDLLDLAIMAVKYDQSLTKLFKSLPSAEELDKVKFDDAINKYEAATNSLKEPQPAEPADDAEPSSEPDDSGDYREPVESSADPDRAGEPDGGTGRGYEDE